MDTLNEFLSEKRTALEAYMAAAAGDPKPVEMSASVDVRGRSGVRVIRIRQFEMISDTGPDLAGFDLGPFSPEHQLAALGGCIAHTAQMVAAAMELSIEKIGVDVHARMHPLAQTPGYESVPRVPHNLRYELNITSGESAEKIEALHRQVQEVCPVYNLIKEPQPIAAGLNHELVSPTEGPDEPRRSAAGSADVV